MNSTITPFQFDGRDVRTVLVGGEPWFVARDVTDALGYSNSNAAVMRHTKGVAKQYPLHTPGGLQTLRIIAEADVLRLIVGSKLPAAEAFERLVFEEILPSVRKTGTYGAPDLSTPQGVLVLAELAAATARDLVAATERAAIAEGFREAIELNAGLTPREFLKKYLPDLRETDFNNTLYRAGLLIDQRAQRVDPRGGRKPGKQHRHPGWAGKPFFYLHTAVDGDGIRREHVRVRPGQPELDLAAWFAARKHQVNRAVAS